MILSCCVPPDPAMIRSSQRVPLQLMDSHFDHAEAASTREDSERLVSTRSLRDARICATGDDLMVQKIKRAAERKAAAEKLAAEQAANPQAP